MLTRDYAFKLLKEYKVPENIVNHSLVVNKVAMYLTRKLKEAGVKVNEDVVDIASLLHDLDKMYKMRKGEIHGHRSYRTLKNLSPEIALVVKKHVLGAILNNGLKTWEEKIVYYADKRVNGTKIVMLEKRYKYLKKRYGSISKEAMLTIQKTEPLVFKLEKDILNKIKGSPEDILIL